ncbi:MAG: energy transducer TonB [Sphingobacterium sp.]
MIYLLIVNISLIISFVLYKLIFRKLTFFQWNRIYLIGMVVFSLLAPVGIFIELPKTEMISNHIPQVDLGIYMDVEIGSPIEEKPLFLLDILTKMYWIGVGVAFFFLIIRIRQLVLVLRSSPEYLSFSFFNRVVIGKSIKNKKNIVWHEQVHTEQGHSYDLLLIELLKIFNWFNPVVYFFQKEIRFQHEYIVDEICSTDKVAYAEMLVAHALRTDQLAFSHEFSNHSFLKQRITMLFKDKSVQRQRLLYAIVLPMLLVVAGSTLVFNTSRAKAMVADVEESVNGLTVTDEQTLPSQPEELKNEQVNEDRKVYKDPEIMAIPVGGMKKYVIGLGNRIHVSDEAIKNNVIGVIVITAIVEKNGELSHIKAKNDLGYSLASAVENAVKASGKWKPAIVNGKVVRSLLSLPVTVGGKTTYYWEETDTLGRKVRMSSHSFPASEPNDETEKRLKDVKPEDESNGWNLSLDFQDDLVAFNKVEVQPTPIGGMRSFMVWVGNNFVFPEAAIKHSVNGIIEVAFVVEKDGSLSHFDVKKDLGYGTKEATLELLKSAKKWRPGIMNGRPVRVAYTLPIRLNLKK